MRNRVIVFRARLLSQAAVAAILAGTVAGCSGDVSRFREPFFTGSTANQREIISSEQPMPAPVAGADGAVTKGDLPPPAGAAPVYRAAAPAGLRFNRSSPGTAIMAGQPPAAR